MWVLIPHISAMVKSALLMILASCYCTSWKAINNGFNTWIPITHMGDLSSSQLLASA